MKSYVKRLPADWFKDSSLETWFPLTARELKSLRAERDALAAQVETLRAALEKIRVKAVHEYPVSIGNQGAWGYVEMIAEDALALTNPPAQGTEAHDAH